MGLRMKNLNIFGVHWKIWFLGSSRKTNIEGGGSPKKRGLDSLQILEGGLATTMGVDTPMHTMVYIAILLIQDDINVSQATGDI